MTLEKRLKRSSSKTEYMPICLRLRGQKCLVIGGGRVALRKINTLRKFGADITCVSPDIVYQLKRLKSQNKIKHVKERYNPRRSLKQYKLVIAATDELCTNQKIAEHAQKEKVLVNIVDGSTQGDVIMPAIIKKSGVLVAISTDGQAPSKAKKVRDSLKNVL